MLLWLLILFGGDAPPGGGPEPAPSVDLTFRRTPRLFGPKRVATVDP